jgi:Common central domain of tyrosinase.
MHNQVHLWVGGDMLVGTSPNDPVFFLHHCNVDRLWAEWQTTQRLPYAPVSGGPSGHNIDDVMGDLPELGVTPRSMLDHHRVGYAYDTERFLATRMTPDPSP